MAHTYGDRYNKYSESSIRNAARPRNEAEGAYQEMVVQRTAKDLLDKYVNEPHFQKALALEIAKQAAANQPQPEPMADYQTQLLSPQPQLSDLELMR